MAVMTFSERIQWNPADLYILHLSGFPIAELYRLDYGFGNGNLLMTAAEYGFACYGVERHRLDREGILISAGIRTSDRIKPQTTYDVISLCDVLEHMPQPKMFLHDIVAHVAPGGVLVIICPAYDTPAWGQMKPNPYWQEQQHYHNFSRRRLVSLMAPLGFVPLSYAAVDSKYRHGMEMIFQRL
jgi:SAM-dependent methyltransferase